MPREVVYTPVVETDKTQVQILSFRLSEASRTGTRGSPKTSVKPFDVRLGVIRGRMTGDGEALVSAFEAGETSNSSNSAGSVRRDRCAKTRWGRVGHGRVVQPPERQVVDLKVTGSTPVTSACIRYGAACQPRKVNAMQHFRQGCGCSR